jgi:hypothetical protein
VTLVTASAAVETKQAAESNATTTAREYHQPRTPRNRLRRAASVAP